MRLWRNEKKIVDREIVMLVIFIYLRLHAFKICTDTAQWHKSCSSNVTNNSLTFLLLFVIIDFLLFLPFIFSFTSLRLNVSPLYRISSSRNFNNKNLHRFSDFDRVRSLFSEILLKVSKLQSTFFSSCTSLWQSDRKQKQWYNNQYKHQVTHALNLHYNWSRETFHCRLRWLE